MSSAGKILLLLLAIVIGYVFGNYLPFELLKPEYKPEIIGKAEYYRLLMSVVSAGITFCAVLVALFKDDIRDYWMRPKIKFSLPDQCTIEDLKSPQDSGQPGESLESFGYYTKFEVRNDGNLATLNAEIYLERLQYKPHNSDILEFIDSPSTALEWIGTDATSIIIPPGGKKYVNIVEITRPEKFSTPAGKQQSQNANLIIGTIENTKDRPRGKWTATFTLYAQNHKPTSFSVVIEWNGVWKQRWAEFSKQYQISTQV